MQEKRCLRCGETDTTAFQKTYYTECKKCRKKATSWYVLERRRKLKEMAVAYKGGKCERCGYDRCITSLVFHHRDASEKEFGISKTGHTRSWERTKAEIDKCELLCANCHGEEHQKDADLRTAKVQEDIRKYQAARLENGGKK